MNTKKRYMQEDWEFNWGEDRGEPFFKVISHPLEYSVHGCTWGNSSDCTLVRGHDKSRLIAIEAKLLGILNTYPRITKKLINKAIQDIDLKLTTKLQCLKSS